MYIACVADHSWTSSRQIVVGHQAAAQVSEFGLVLALEPVRQFEKLALFCVVLS
jgi:hypothetical protein